jgi:hypothetical protein
MGAVGRHRRMLDEVVVDGDLVQRTASCATAVAAAKAAIERTMRSSVSSRMWPRSWIRSTSRPPSSVTRTARRWPSGPPSSHRCTSSFSMSPGNLRGGAKRGGRTDRRTRRPEGTRRGDHPRVPSIRIDIRRGRAAAGSPTWSGVWQPRIRSPARSELRRLTASTLSASGARHSRALPAGGGAPTGRTRAPSGFARPFRTRESRSRAARGTRRS